MFIGTYIQPEGARNFNVDMYSEVAEVAGDFNARPGFNDGIWNYEPNKDVVTNKHGRTCFRDLCMSTDIRPVNSLKYGRRVVHNDFTYFGGNGKSQIDFCLTDNVGKKCINSFKIISDDWHVSDHKPISLEVQVFSTINISALVTRAVDLYTW